MKPIYGGDVLSPHPLLPQDKMKEREGVGALAGIPELKKKTYFKIKRRAQLLTIIYRFSQA